MQTARAFAGLPKGIREIKLSRPLLHDTDSLDRVAQILIQSAPKERKPGDALVFVERGTRHAAVVYYPAMQYYMHSMEKMFSSAQLRAIPVWKTCSVP